MSLDNNNTLNKSAIVEWINALESGAFKQGRNALRRHTSTGEIQYCCLGVLCELQRENLGAEWESDGNVDEFVVDGTREGAVLPQVVIDALGMSQLGPSGTLHPKVQYSKALTTLNDGYTHEIYTFPQIASEIRAALTKYEEKIEGLTNR